MNNFAGDPTCKALFRFETGSLLVDTISSNDLTNLNTVVTDESAPQEGISNAKFTATNQGLYIPDASLVAGVPLKNGDATKKATFCLWYKSNDNSAVSKVIISKWFQGNPSVAKACFLLNHYYGSLSFGWGTSDAGGDWVLASFYGIPTDRACHIAIVIDGVAKTVKIRIWDAVNGVSNHTHTYGTALNVSSGDLFIGNDGQDQTTAIDGWIDEVVAFNRCLSDDEIDLIRQGLYRRCRTFPLAPLQRQLQSQIGRRQFPVIP